MSVIKCKMCGGDLNFEEGQTVCECEYCGSKQTIPTADSEKKLTLFGRAGRLMRACEFDKAAGIFESIVAEFPEEAEAYWGLVLSRYGIEYVDDPATGKKIPTCHRSSFQSVMEDSDFEQACENADAVARKVYREQAKEIEELRRAILDVSASEQPYDIFISYKEKDENGERTMDSVLAQDIYGALTDKGYRVFFSRISLEDKLGTEYEPYIFAALNSAKVMLVVGTDYDYFNAVWVKNEWSRFLKLMASDKSKHLIPCFKGIDAYDMPKEFNKLAAQDLGKVGAVQDLLRGIDKLTGRSERQNAENASTVQQTVIQQMVSGGPNVDALLRRGYDSLEDGAFEEAKTFFNDALNSNAQSAEAYLGLFMAEVKAQDRTAAQDKYVAGDYTGNRYWKRAGQYASGTLADTFHNWDALRDARLRGEADAARREKEAAEREIESLREQLRSGEFELTAKEQAEQKRLDAAAQSAAETAQNADNAFAGTPEVQEVDRLVELISSKRIRLASLGFFKGREKKELQAQIDALEGSLQAARNRVSGKRAEISRLKEQAEAARKKATEYGDRIKAEKRKELKHWIAAALSLHIANTGDIITLGSYEQGNGKEPVAWRVLDAREGKMLLISEYALECRKYLGTYTAFTWEKCDLRKWLNHEFLETAFEAGERELIADTVCPADRNPQYGTDPGNATTDKIFLLSIPEAEKYFRSNEDRKAAPTAYAKKQGAYTDQNQKTAAGEACCWWWLRSPGLSSRDAADVGHDGSVRYGGDDVGSDGDCVRPALWINLES